ncbi:MAG: hypothetical protein ACI9GW_003569 [Halieaceae bacterium]|jgi:uncharacterized protein
MLLDMRKLAARGTVVNGFIAVAELARIKSLLASDRGTVTAHCEFSTDEEGRALLTVRSSVTLDVACQRCLEATQIEVTTDSVLCVVTGEDKIGTLPASMEPLIIAEDPANLWSVVEDELLLGLPIVSYHEAGACAELVEKYRVGPEPTDERSTPSPFEVLQQLKSQNQE